VGQPKPETFKTLLEKWTVFNAARLRISPVASLLPEAQQFEVYPARDCKIMYYLP
jgi:hypothetical protein